jgi:SAM-dependent methyltransferase
MSEDILSCPCEQKRDLVTVGDARACSNSACEHSKPPHFFKNFHGAPVLISFDRTDTVCTPLAYETGVFYFERSPGAFMTLARKIFYGVSPVTTANCDTFVGMVKEGGKSPAVLVVGSGSKGSGTEKLWSDSDIKITGTDIYYTSTVNYIADAHYLPFKNESFDGVWIQAVLEHVADPVAVVAEIERVLKPGGAVYAETPFMQQVHEGGYDFSRYSVTGHRYLFKNFSLAKMGGNQGPAFVLAWSVKYLVWGLTRSKQAGIAACLPFFLLARALDPLIAEKSMWDAASGVFFLGRKHGGVAVRAKELPGLYEGFQR